MFEFQVRFFSNLIRRMDNKEWIEGGQPASYGVTCVGKSLNPNHLNPMNGDCSVATVWYLGPYKYLLVKIFAISSPSTQQRAINCENMFWVI